LRNDKISSVYPIINVRQYISISMRITIAQLKRLIRETLTSEEAEVPGRWTATSGEPIDDEDEERRGYGGFVDPIGDELEETKNTLWGNIRARRKAGKPRLKPGQKGYPKTLDVESQEMSQGHEDPSKLVQTMNRQGDGYEFDQMGRRKKN